MQAADASATSLCLCLQEVGAGSRRTVTARGNQENHGTEGHLLWDDTFSLALGKWGLMHVH